MLEVNPIEDKIEAKIAESSRLKQASHMACIYYPEVACSSPRLQFKICCACPKCAPYAQAGVERSLFKHIKAYAISLLEKMNVQFSK